MQIKGKIWNGKFEGISGYFKKFSGKFELKDESLNLIFDKTEQVTKSKIQIIETKAESKKKIKIEFDIKDENGFELPANIIRTSDHKHFFFDEVNRIVAVDKNSPKAKYRVEFIGYETLELEIDNITDKVIKIFRGQYINT